MSHAPHVGPSDAILYDNCPECTERASNPLDGLCHLDPDTFSRLVDRVREVEYARPGSFYRTENEARIGKAVYRLLVLIERHPGTLDRGRLT